jgi:hypothetical protein
MALQMTTIAVSEFPWAREQQALRTLNRLAQFHRAWSSRLISGAIGCRSNEAMSLLWFLYNAKVVNPMLVIYHKHEDTNSSPPTLYRDFFQGPPLLPFTCDICGEVVTNEDELSYDLEFVFTDKVSFSI